MANPFLNILKTKTSNASANKAVPFLSPLIKQPETPVESVKNFFTDTFSKAKNVKAPTITKPKTVAPMEFKVGEGLNEAQTKTAYEKISNPDTAMKEGQDNQFLNILKKGIVKEFSPRTEAVPIRRPFEITPIETKAPPIVTQLGSLGFAIIEAIPKMAATIGGEFQAKFKPDTVKANIDLRRLGFDSPEYVTAAKEQQDAINNGENPWISGLKIISTKTLDVAFGAQLVSDLAKLSTSILLKGGVEARIEAQSIVDAYKVNQKEAFARLKNAPLDVREKAMADMVNAKNQAEKVLAEQGAPTATDRARVNASRYTEVIGRQTPITKNIFSDILKPNYSLKTPVSTAPKIEAKQLPGTREKPGQAPAFGLSTKEVENVGYGAEKGASKIIDDITTPEGVAKKLIRTYVERGETLSQLQSGYLGASGSDFSANIVSGGKIKITKIGGQEVDYTVSLKKAFDDIKNGVETTKSKSLFDSFANPKATSDAHDIQEIRNSINEGKTLLQDKTLSPEKRASIVKSIENAQTKIGAEKKDGYTIQEISSDQIFTKNDIGIFNRNSHFNVDWNKDYNDTISNIKEELNLDKIPDELKDAWDSFIEKYTDLYKKGLEIRANNPSPVVTGRANFNYNRSNKLLSREQNAYEQRQKLVNDFEKKVNQYNREKEATRKSTLTEEDKLKEKIAKNERMINGLNPERDPFFINKLKKENISLNKKISKIPMLEKKPKQIFKNENSANYTEKENTRIAEVSNEYWDKVIKPQIEKGEAVVIGADDLKDFFGKDYLDANHKIYSRSAFRIYEEALKVVKNPTVFLTGGGPASGKTDFVVGNIKGRGFDGIIYDSNMANYDGVVKQVELAKENGKSVRIAGIIPDLDMARKYSIIRENETGRGISEKTFAKGHVGFPQTVVKLLENKVILDNQVDILDARDLTLREEFLQKAINGDYIKDPLATLQKLEYNEESIIKNYGKQNFNLKTGERESGLAVRQKSDTSLREDRSAQDEINGRGDRGPILQNESGKTSVGGGKEGEGTGTEVTSLSKIDRLIAENKIRVVSRGDRDVYQYKKGSNWVNARDEDSAIHQVTKEPYQPKPKVYAPKDQEKLDGTKAMLENVRERLAEHPGKTLMQRIDRKEGQIEDYRNPDLAKSEAERQKIIAKNHKMAMIAQKAMQGHPTLSDDYDNVDTLREVLDDYRGAREVEKSLVATKNELIDTLKPIDKTTAPLGKAQPKSSPLDTTTGEGRSIELQSEQALSILGSEPFPINVSLPTIIENTVTPVKQKVHLIDIFLRTPHFVMEKIGFGKEAGMLRDAMDSYWKELPKNIDVITKWSKEVSKEGNKDIFRFLDGEAITLKPQDKKVALEIKDWLKDWAKRLNLPEDNQISHYITHIFEKEFITKEFDEELAKIIADKIPGQVYDPFLLKRLGKKGYKQDTWAALDAYVKRATRKVNMDPVLEVIQDKAGVSLEYSNIEKSQFNYIKDYIDNINMRPSDAEEGIDNFVKSVIGYKLGQRPVISALKFFRQATFRGMLGLNPASALRNLSQGINTYAVLKEKYTAIGYVKLFSRGAGEELAREGVLNAGFVEDRALNATKKAIEKADKVLFAFFNTAEKINRGAAYFGAKSKGLNEGMSETEAVKYAKQIVRQTQFVFDAVDTPVGMSSQIMKTLFQFQTFTTKQIEFLTNMGRAKDFTGLLRYALAGMAFVYTVGKTFGMDPKELLPWYRFDTPPSLKFPVEVTKAVFDAPDKYGQPRDLNKKLKDVGTSSIGLIPAGSQIKKTIQGIQAINEGGSFDKGGKLQFSQGQSMAEKAQSVLFGKYASDEAQNYFNKSEINAKQFEKIKPIYEEAQAFIKDGKDTEAQTLVDQLTEEEYALYKKYRTAEITKATTQGKKDILPKYLEIQKLKESDPDKAQAEVDALSEDEYKYYELVKKQIEKDQKASDGTKPTYEDGEAQTERGIVGTVFTYAKALGTDPVTAFDRIFTGQIIRRVDNGAIIVNRMPFMASTKVKAEKGFTGGSMKLDHQIPLQLGGSNDEDNLNLVTEAQWSSYTPVENYLGKKLRDGKLEKKEVQDLITRFKNGEVTAQDVYDY